MPLSGKKGIGLGKRARAPSPTSGERLAKMAKLAEASKHDTYRDRTKEDYEERRADGRLRPAQSTCINLDEKDGVKFNVLWLNPQEPDAFPAGLLDALKEHPLMPTLHLYEHRVRSRFGESASISSRLKTQMKADALHALSDGEVDHDAVAAASFSEDTLEETVQFLRLNAQDRLHLVLSYLRERYFYCFWCGTQYDDDTDLLGNCPGTEEDAHD